MGLDDAAGVPSIIESTPAVGFVLDIPPGGMRGWVVIGELPDGTFKVASSICCVPHLMALMATVIAETTAEAAEGIRPHHVT